MHQRPEQKELTVAQAWAAERAVLQPVVAPFDGSYESKHAVSGTCLISFDRNRYSVSARVVRRAVQGRAYADRIVVRCKGGAPFQGWELPPALARRRRKLGVGDDADRGSSRAAIRIKKVDERLGAGACALARTIKRQR